MREKLLAENHGGHCCRNFAKQKFWKVENIKLFLVKHNSIFGWDIKTEKTTFSFYEHFVFNIFFKKTMRKKASE